MIRTRLEIEDSENKILAVYAMHSRDAGPREHSEAAHETRTCFQRDRDRIVHSEAFRKLEYKTQVFGIFEGDYYRTRLTHTIEVAQIARTIGRNLRLNEDLIEAIALAHDLGHPPFGHAGEDALNQIMKEAGLRGFNHNQRSFDIVTKLEKRYPQFDGLNLTPEVLVGILKHRTVYDLPGQEKKYMQEEPTLEAQVVDIADSLAYLNHDIDDGLTSTCIHEEDLAESTLWQTAIKKLAVPLRGQGQDMRKYQIVKELIDMQVKDLLVASEGNIIRKKFKSSRDVKRCRETVIGFSPAMAQERNYLQELLNKKLYHHSRVERMTGKAKRIIKALFDVYRQNPNQLPEEVYRKSRKYAKRDIYGVICNYIASMTDRFALDEYKKLFHPYEKV